MTELLSPYTSDEWDFPVGWLFALNQISWLAFFLLLNETCHLLRQNVKHFYLMFLVANKHMMGGMQPCAWNDSNSEVCVKKKKSVEDTEIKFEIPILKEKMDVKISQQEYWIKCKECQDSSISTAHLWAKQTTAFLFGKTWCDVKKTGNAWTSIFVGWESRLTSWTLNTPKDRSMLFRYVKDGHCSSVKRRQELLNFRSRWETKFWKKKKRCSVF